MTEPYSLNNYNIYWSPKEASLGKMGAGAVDETNAVDDPFYYMIMKVEKHRYRQMVKAYSIHTPGSVDECLQGHTNMEDFEHTISGPLYNLSMLYFLVKSCTTAGGPTYTHTTLSTDARETVCPTFQFLAKMINTTANHRLLVGVAIKKWRLDWSLSNQPTLSITFTIRREVAGTALTTFPSKPAISLLGSDQVTATLKKATTAYTGKIIGGFFEWDDGVTADVFPASPYPTEMNYNKRSIKIGIDYKPDNVTLWNDSQDISVGTGFKSHARDIDFQLTLERSATDKLVIDSGKLMFTKAQALGFTFNDYYDVQQFELQLDPLETGFLHTLVVTDLLPNTRYEGV